MGGLTPLECFLAGVAAASTGLALLLFFVLRSVGKRLKQLPESFADPDEGARLDEPSATAFHRRLLDVEKRLSELERQARPQVVA